MLTNTPAPFVGQRCGKAMTWHGVALKASEKTAEKCEHLCIATIVIKMAPIEEGFGPTIKFRVSCSECNMLFPLTSLKLTKKFVEFYKLGER